MTVTAASAERIRRLQGQMTQAGVDLAAIAPTANMRYLLGFAPLADERPCMLLVTPQTTRFLVPELNADQVEAHTGLEAMRWADAAGPEQALARALGEIDVKPKGILAVDNSMRFDAFLLLQNAARPGESVAASDLMTSLRIRKAEAEIEALADAAAMADAAFMEGVEACQPGVTEREVAERIAASFRSQGAEKIDFILVASGPNGAFPHHETGDRRLQTGDTIVIDIGATLDGYLSDVTRVVHLGEPSTEVREIYEIVRQANQCGREAAVAGAHARVVDQAARAVINEAGYGPQFFHRTGHGLGLEVHEPPWITSESETLLEPGMVFSVEPGIYLSDRFGIRIEDIVVVTKGECRRLTGLSHDLIVKA